MIAAVLLAAAIPASASGALVVADARGFKALFESAGSYSPSLSPEGIGRTLIDMVGVDLLSEQPKWGLARGARILAFTPGAVGLSAPVKNLKSARRAMAIWRKGASNRAGAISAHRVLLASGRGAAALVKAMKRPKPLSKELRSRARGPAWLWLRFAPPLREALFALDASAAGLIARGLVLPANKAPLLAGSAPGPCDDAPAGCLRAGIGAAGHDLLGDALREAGRSPPPDAARFSSRLDGFDLRQLTDQRSLPRAPLWSISFDAPAAAGPALAGQLDLADIDKALATLTPLDALRGSAAASAYAAHLLYGFLLRAAGPLTLTGSPAGNGAEIELRLPITSR
ncbi:MAG TPA: hypothetical protein VF993_06485 [Myxococcales bacterium]